MFAIYQFQEKRKQQQYLGIGTLYFEAEFGSKSLRIPLDELAKVILEKRKKLAPLITGGVITSLSLLSIFLYSARFEIVILIAFGLLLTYFGLHEYTVLHIEHGNTSQLLWLPMRDKLENVRPFVAILEYYVSRKQFPVLYASPTAELTANLIHYQSSPVRTDQPIIYQFGRDNTGRIPQVAVNPTQLDNPISISGQGKVIAESNHLINQEAVIDLNSVNIS